MPKNNTHSIGTYIVFILFILWLNLPNFYLAIKLDDQDTFLKNLSVTLALIAFVFAFAKKAKNVFLLFCIPALLVPYEIYYIHSFGKASDAHLFGILSESNFDEAHGYISGLEVYFGCLFLITGAALIAIAKKIWLLPLTFNTRIRFYLLSGSLLISSIPSIFMALGDSVVTEVHAAASVNEEPVLGAEIIEDCFFYKTDSALVKSYPLGLITRYYCFAHDRLALNKVKKITQDFVFNATLGKQSSSRQIHLLVIGETGRPSRWQLFGYERETNPKLSQQNNLLLFSNVVSPWAWTRMSVPIIVTRKKGIDKNPVFPEKSMVGAFNESGFNTVWLSNQSATGYHDASTTLYASEAKQVLFINPAAYYGSGSYDAELLPHLEKVLASNSQDNLFIVLHTLGSHFNYADRYPKTFKKYSPSLEDAHNISMHDVSLKENLSNSYDNSILYTDYFLKSVIELLEKQNAITTMFYVADHGENLFDGKCDKSGHGRGNEWDYFVPMLWWYSDQYKQHSPERIVSAQNHQHKKLSTENIFHSYLDMVGITYPQQNLTKSLFNKQFEEQQRYVNAQTTLNFDLAKRKGDCRTLSN